ncbi:MAG: type II toxin-antitoxin system RelE/ParE family toxin [Burkholderiales bacterium]|nr:type II toxin-antitoxin system RelE/ParE family toxin [Burkholderiales bacterium]
MNKPIDWRGTALDDLKAFPDHARKQAGRELRLVQRGLVPTDWKPFERLGPGGRELRISCADGWFRIMYVAKLEEAIYVLHCFQKQGRKTSKIDIEIAATRYRAVIKERGTRK